MRVGLVLVCLVGCARDPVEAICPDISEGALAVSEVRGPQDADGAWIELYNTTSSAIDLEGTRVRFRRKDGSSEIPIIVRHTVVVDAGDYAVLGLFFDAERPAHIDYGFLDDFDGAWLSAAAIDVESCGQLIDRATYDALPDSGTFELGTDPPDAEANNLPASWCFDPTVAGTPGMANPPCP